MGRIYHCNLDIAGALRNPRWLDGIKDDHGVLLTREQAKAQLQRQYDAGARCIPVGERCDGFDDVTGCPGHEQDDQVARKAD